MYILCHSPQERRIDRIDRGPPVRAFYLSVTTKTCLNELPRTATPTSHHNKEQHKQLRNVIHSPPRHKTMDIETCSGTPLPVPHLPSLPMAWTANVGSRAYPAPPLSTDRGCVSHPGPDHVPSLSGYYGVYGVLSGVHTYILRST